MPRRRAVRGAMPARFAAHGPRESGRNARAARSARPARIAVHGPRGPGRSARANRGTRVGRRGRRLRRPGNGCAAAPHARRAVVFGRARLMVVRGGMVLLRWSVRLVSPRATALARGRCVVSRVEGIGRVSIDGRAPRGGGRRLRDGAMLRRRPPPHVALVVFDRTLRSASSAPRSVRRVRVGEAGASRRSSPRSGFLRACLPTRTSHRLARPDGRRRAQASSAPASRRGPRTGWRVPMIVAALGLPPRLPPD